MSLQPWIHDYVIEIAEQFGADYFNAPVHKKSKTVQLIEFLHRGSEGQDSNVWARVSDSQFFIIVKFTSEAVAEYLSISQNKRLTQYRTAIIRIKNFKLFFGRVAIEENKMTPNATLAVECTSVAPYGSFDEAKIKDPKDVTANPRVRSWILGLREGGGSGNILREQRIEREKQKPTAEINQSDSAPMLERQKLDAIVRKPMVKRAPPKTPAVVVKLANASRPEWKPKMPSFYEVPPEILASLRELPIEGDEAHPPPKHSLDGGTDENNEGPSKRSRTEDGDDNEKQDDVDVDDDVEDVDMRSSQPLTDWPPSGNEDRPPTPGQQQDPSAIEILGPPSPDSQNANLGGSQGSLVPSSSPLGPLPLSSFYAKVEVEPFSSGAVEKKAKDIPQDPRSRVMRRVPPPKQPQEPESSGPERILVPASDTSMSQSQSQPHSQLRSQAGREGRWQQQRTEASQGGSSMRGLMEDETRRLGDPQGMSSQRGRGERQLARKSSYKKITTGVSEEVTLQLDEDDEETDKRVGPRDGEGNNRDGTSAATVSTSTSTAASRGSAPGQHEPRAWKEPSFMKRKGRVKLGGFTVELKGLQKGSCEKQAWVSWRELEEILERSLDGSDM